MVVLHVKRGDESLFLFETKLDSKIESVQAEMLTIYNGRLKISRVCYGNFLFLVLLLKKLKSSVKNVQKWKN